MALLRMLATASPRRSRSPQTGSGPVAGRSRLACSRRHRLEHPHVSSTSVLQVEPLFASGGFVRRRRGRASAGPRRRPACGSAARRTASIVSRYSSAVRGCLSARSACERTIDSGVRSSCEASAVKRVCCSKACCNAVEGAVDGRGQVGQLGLHAGHVDPLGEIGGGDGGGGAADAVDRRKRPAGEEPSAGQHQRQRAAPAPTARSRARCRSCSRWRLDVLADEHPDVARPAAAHLAERCRDRGCHLAGGGGIASVGVRFVDRAAGVGPDRSSATAPSPSVAKLRHLLRRELDLVLAAADGDDDAGQGVGVGSQPRPSISRSSIAADVGVEQGRRTRPPGRTMTSGVPASSFQRGTVSVIAWSRAMMYPSPRRVLMKSLPSFLRRLQMYTSTTLESVSSSSP